MDLPMDDFGRQAVQWFMTPNIHHREYSEVFVREPVAESFTEASITPGSLALFLHLCLPEALQNNKLEIQNNPPHGVYKHLDILLHIIESKEMLSSLILDQAVSLKELHRCWKN